MNRLNQVRRAHNALTKTLVDVSDATNIEDVLDRADLNFEVALQELSSQVVTPEGLTQINYVESGVVRMDNLRPIGVVGERYTPIQNRDAFSPLHFLQSEGFIEAYEQAGVLGHGQRCFVIARLNKDINLIDEHHGRIMFSTSHDGSGAFQVRALAERVWCSNQIPNLDRISQRVLSIRHTSSADYQLKMVKQAVLNEMDWLDEYTQWYDKMLNTEVDLPRTSAYVNQIAPRRDPKMVAERERLNDERRQDKILARINGQYNVNIAGTVAALFQGAVEYSDYDARGRNADRILTGRDIKFKKRAWESAKALV
tara:strand:- start:561 stop:1496 length:936 start_codon:yes stop_codon:yes gene_type:complete